MIPCVSRALASLDTSRHNGAVPPAVPFDYRAATATSASAITSVATVTSITLSYSDVDPARSYTNANL